jgi:hypothetical protein
MRVEEATSPPLPTFNCGLWRAQQAGQLPTLGILYIGPSCGSGLRQPEYAAGRARAPGPPCRRRRASGAAGGGGTDNDAAAHSAAVRRPAGCASCALPQVAAHVAAREHDARRGLPRTFQRRLCGGTEVARGQSQLERTRTGLGLGGVGERGVGGYKGGAASPLLSTAMRTSARQRLARAGGLFSDTYNNACPVTGFHTTNKSSIHCTPDANILA